MKKTYIQPALEAIEMKYNTTLMAGSDTLGLGDGTLDAGNALGREGDDLSLFEDDIVDLSNGSDF
jgi:hypothetical protein